MCNSIEEEWQQDPILRNICEDLHGKPESHGNNTLGNDILHFEGRLVLASTSCRILKLLHEFLDPYTG
jgi:hypothetical protein